MTTNILVVDDLQLERLLIEGLLAKTPDYRVQLASDGRQALEKIAAETPDLVVTDLVMPHIDGLELVRTIRQQYPDLPVILMTAYGDETTAIEALEAGAASYVPKAQKAERLLTSIERVLDHAVANRFRQRLTRTMFEYHCRFALENDRRLIRELVSQVQQAMAGIGAWDVVERIRMGEALEEALLNAMYHGNLGISNDELARVRAELDERLLDRLVEERCRETSVSRRRILLVVHLTESEARFVIRDEGLGFNQAFLTGAKDADRFAAGYSRGMTLINTLMDEVTFNKSGNELVMRRAVAMREEPNDVLVEDPEDHSVSSSAMRR